MKTTAMIMTATVMMCGVLHGQNVVYQQAVTSGPTGVGVGGGFGFGASGPIGARSITGSPFSGTEERRSLQVLSDGTRIERNDASQISRDSEGRTRSELPGKPDGHSIVTIQDPVAGVHYMLDSAQKTANRIPMPPKGAAGFSVTTGAVASRVSVADGASGPVVLSGVPLAIPAMPMTPSEMKADEESLGTQTINGVAAKGTRSTINIPAGQIGNDRPIQVVSERWYSDELQMVVKSSNSDPRFGTTTYELTNISRGEPDPSLFQVPADYAVKEGNAAFFTTNPTK